MASNENEDRLQCSKCDHFLDLASRTLPCLHSFCGPCVEVIVGGNGPCPQCHQPVTGDELRLAPFLVKALTVRHLESGEWRCEFCSEDGIESTPKIWCQDCQKLLCQTCERFHKKFHPGHETKDLSGLARDEAIRVMTTDDCRRHCKSKDSFCDRCNLCLCEACYADHVTASPQCPPRPLSVGEEASKEKRRGPTLERQLRELEIRIRAANEQTRRSIDELSTDCDAECAKVWQEFEAFVEGARRQLGELCENMRQATSERVRKWRHSLKERDDLLKKVKVWRQTSRRLLRDDDAEDGDIVCGLRLMGAELSAWLPQSFAPVGAKGQFVVTFPKWCHDSLESLKKESIHLLTAKTFDGHLQLETECRLQGSKPDSCIPPIVADDEDNHVFVCHLDGGSILEFGESGELVDECRLMDGRKRFYPWDMCRLSKDIWVVSCPCGWVTGVPWVLGSRLFFLVRQKCRPFLKIQKIIDTKQKKFFSLCQKDKKIFACEKEFKEIVCFNENGEELKTIKIRGSPGTGIGYPRLRADPRIGDLWGGREGTWKIYVWEENSPNFLTLTKEKKMTEKIFDFCSNGFRIFYSTKKGIFWVSREEVLSETRLSETLLYKFREESEDSPRIFVSREKLFVFFKNDGKKLLKSLKIN